MDHILLRNSRKKLLLLFIISIGVLAAVICIYHLRTPKRPRYDSDIMHDLEDDIREYARRRTITTVLFEMQVEIDGKIAIYYNEYGQIGIESEDVKKEQTEVYTPYLGDIFAEADYVYTLQGGDESQEVKVLNWHRVKECNNLKYLIGKDEKGYLSLWKFSGFMEDAKDVFFYENLLSDIYGFRDAEDVLSVQLIARNESTNQLEFIDYIQDPDEIVPIYDMISGLRYCVDPVQNTAFKERFVSDHEDGYIRFLLKHKDGTESEWFIYDIRTGALDIQGTPHIDFTEALQTEDALRLCDMFDIAVEEISE